MTKSQKLLCMMIGICMVGSWILCVPSGFLTDEIGKKCGSLQELLPLFSFYQMQEASTVAIEDEKTSQEIIQANQKYLKEQVKDENKKLQEEQREEIPEASIEPQKESEETSIEPVQVITREKLEDPQYLLDHFFIVDENTATNSEQINAAALLDQNLVLPEEQPSPQILIYHSHSQEGFADSAEGDPQTTVVGVGEVLTGILQETYGYGVVHITDTFDVVNGEIDRNSAYDYARETVVQVLEEYPSIEVVIDLHRDGVPEEKHLVTEVDGKPTAQIMLFNGLSYSAVNGEIAYLPNPYIAQNLAFSFQIVRTAEEYYPGFNRPIYLSSLRYNLHLKPRALLLEVGAQNNTVEEAKNAMEPFAWILNKILKGE